jgi:hypothetical protein
MKPVGPCRLAILATILLTFLSGAADARPVDPNLQAEFRRIIETQIEAFRHDDGETAFAQASPAIRERLGTAEKFMEMVRNTYEPVYRPRDYEFEPALAFPDRTAQPVRFIGPDGRGVLGVYYMEQQPDGSWRIGGVYLLPLGEREI